ncbi:MAG: hypothetical protein LZF60_360076 [Nitrospira sp.]|nr:MAG: hypothetical protein LZF60_360076 [Nitrospira sp.]
MGKYLNMIREDGKSRGRLDRSRAPLEKPVLAKTGDLIPGALVTWPGNDAPVFLDCLHTEPDGSVWAFVTMPDGWAAINASFVVAVPQTPISPQQRGDRARP